MTWRELPAGLWLAIRESDIAWAAAGFTPPPDSSLWTQPFVTTEVTTALRGRLRKSL